MLRYLPILIGIVLGSLILSPRRAEVAEGPPPPAVAKPSSPWGTPVRSGPLTLIRDRQGAFNVAGQVNGKDAEFIVDTGASVVALTIDDARRMGLRVDPTEFRPMIRSASGVGNGVRLNISWLQIGGTELNDVEAVVVEGLGHNLLGQTALQRLGKVELQGDRMVIHPL